MNRITKGTIKLGAAEIEHNNFSKPMSEQPEDIHVGDCIKLKGKAGDMIKITDIKGIRVSGDFYWNYTFNYIPALAKTTSTIKATKTKKGSEGLTKRN